MVRGEVAVSYERGTPTPEDTTKDNRGTSPVRKRLPLGLYSRAMLRALRWSWGGVAFSCERGTPVHGLRERQVHHAVGAYSRPTGVTRN